MAKQKQYSFLEKKPSKRAKSAIRYGALSVGVFLILLMLAFLTSGSLPQASGGIGFMGVVLSMVGFITGMKDMIQSPSPNIYTTIGTLMSGVIFMIWMGMYILGLLT